MPKAIEVAQELRKLADALEKGGETEIPQPWISFYQWSSKEKFVALGRLLPRPVEKDYSSSGDFVLRHENDAIKVEAKTSRTTVCTLVKEAVPAVYECVPLLSDEEEAELTEVQP